MTQDDQDKDKREEPEEADSEEAEEVEDEEDDEKGEVFLPPLDISSLILPFYTQALLKLGLIEDPSGPAEENLELAKRMIDLLDLFKARTQGHLEPDEEKFLDSMLQQLKLHYMQKAKIINL